MTFRTPTSGSLRSPLFARFVRLLPFRSFRFLACPVVRGTQTARRVGWAVGGCLLFAAAACDAGLDCDWDKVSPSVTESKVASYFLQQLRPVHALRLPMAGNRVAGLHEVWLEKCWRYSCADRHYVSRGVQFMAVLDSGRVLEENHFLTLDGENGLGRFNNQLYL